MVGLGFPLSQVGHLIAYLARYGRSGLVLEATGVHAYFPELLRSAACLLGIAILATLLLLAGSRLAIGRWLGGQLSAGEPLGPLVLVAAVVQMDLYTAQETVETLVSAQSYTFGTLALILGWGLVGQLPVALAGAVAVRWLSLRLDVLTDELRNLWQECVAVLRRLLDESRRIQLVATGHDAPALATEAYPALAERGPPDRF
jgi:hypothetical protein